MTQSDPVDHVAEGSSEHQGQSRGEQKAGAARQPEQPDDDGDAHGQCKSDEHPPLPAGGGGQKAEGRAHIVHARDIENGQHARELEFAVVARDVGLGDLIQQHDEGRQQQPGRGPAAMHGDRVSYGIHAN